MSHLEIIDVLILAFGLILLLLALWIVPRAEIGWLRRSNRRHSTSLEESNSSDCAPQDCK